MIEIAVCVCVRCALIILAADKSNFHIRKAAVWVCDNGIREILWKPRNLLKKINKLVDKSNKKKKK